MRRRAFLSALLAAGASRLLPRSSPPPRPPPSWRYVVGADYGPEDPVTVLAVVCRTGGVVCLYPGSVRYWASIDEAP